jgi:hypothetical protein
MKEYLVNRIEKEFEVHEKSFKVLNVITRSQKFVKCLDCVHIRLLRICIFEM